jgi:hypothetical protein
VRTFCESLFSSSRATEVKIQSVKRYSDHNGVLHRFLIFHIIPTGGRDFYLSIDRREDPAVPLRVFALQGVATRLAKDTARHYSTLLMLVKHSKSTLGRSRCLVGLNTFMITQKARTKQLSSFRLQLLSLRLPKFYMRLRQCLRVTA